MSKYSYHTKGMYKSNEKLFANKLEAILEANHSNTHVEWDYHNDVFDRYPWDVEPPVELEELYHQRALQLRDAYDHLVLMYSGGVDSWYILNTFIKHNIRLDEIYMYGPFEAEEKIIEKIGHDRSPGYYTREIRQSLPLLKKLVANKNIKINIFDWTNPIINAMDNPDWIWSVGVRFDPTCAVRGTFHKIFREHNTMLDRGKRVGFVYGIDKPRLIRNDTSIYFSFLDVIFSTGVTPQNEILGENWENDEFFYWTPNMPELAIKQSHMVVNQLKIKNNLGLIKHINNLATFHDENYYQEVNRIIYPEWDHNIWQVKKPTSPVYNEQSRWFLESNLEARKKWESSIMEVERMLGKKWFNKDSIRHGLRANLSGWYRIANY